MAMKIILKQDVKSLGYKDDVVSVKNGYGRNFLIPQGIGTLATPSNLKMLAEDQRQAQFKQDRVKNSAIEMAAKMQDVSINIPMKTGANGKIFGSVTSLQVANALKEKGFDVDRRKIVLNDDIKVIGEYKATANLHKETSVEIMVHVIEEA